jgi:hypothetical protein
MTRIALGVPAGVVRSDEYHVIPALLALSGRLPAGNEFRCSPSTELLRDAAPGHDAPRAWLSRALGVNSSNATCVPAATALTSYLQNA